MKRPFKPKLVFALLLSVIVLNTLTLSIFTKIDNVVNTDLYEYGLQFNPEWTESYWSHSWAITYLLIISTLLVSISIASILVDGQTAKKVCYPLLISGIALNLFSAFLLVRLDYIINHDLYEHGLQFSYGWAMNYWTYSKVFFGSIGFSGAIMATSLLLIFFSQPKPTRMDKTEVFYPIFLTVGVAAFILSVIYTSIILAFVGLGLTFWGAILGYVKTEEYTKKSLLDATALSSLTTLNQIMQELDFKGKAIYLSPKYFKEPESVKTFIPKRNRIEYPTPEQIQEQEESFFVKNPEGVLLTPPGLELAKLFEKTLETNFTRVNLRYLEQHLPKLFIEDLEIAQNFEIETSQNRIRIKLENTPYKTLNNETMKLSPLYNSVGTPISSAIACTLAKASGKPIVIEDQQVSEDGKLTVLEYQILEEG
ncbi:MAG: hypothetical protein QXX08_04090 [Candidatus Bathyarchaeia archaeon]